MTTVAITGIAGHVGRRLLRALDQRADVDRVVGLDLVAPRGCRSTKLSFRQLDVADAELASALRGVDVVVHLAAQVAHGPGDVEVARANTVESVRNVAHASRVVGARQLVHVSSVFAYGAHPDNDLPLTEASPVRPSAGLHLGEHQAEAEAALATALADVADDGPTVTVLRLAMVLGPGMDNVLTRLLEAPRLVTVRGHRPPVQFLHLDDAASAIEHVIDQRLAGTYNVGAEGWLSFDEAAAIAAKRTLDVPEEVAYSTRRGSWTT